MSSANPLRGAPRIHGELLKFGIEIGQATVAKYMVRRRGAPSPTWRTFLRNHAEGIAAIDMFVVMSASFRPLYVTVILAHERRTIIHTAVTETSHCGLVIASGNRSVSMGHCSALSAARSRSYGQHFRRRVDPMAITEVITACSPSQNGYIERVIGSIRRECLDHIVIFNKRHLRRVCPGTSTITKAPACILRSTRIAPTHAR